MSTEFSLDHLDIDEEMPAPELHYFSAPVRLLEECHSRSELSSEQEKKLSDWIWAIVEKSEIDILSLDVFDTYLLRNNKPEALRYMELSQLVLDRLKNACPQHRQLQALTAEDVCETRIMGMRKTYRTRPLVQGNGEGRIEEAIALQRLMLGLDDDADEVMLEAEIDYEADNLTENRLLFDIARRFKADGGDVILISDMYLGGDTIGRIIDKLQSYPVHSHLFSSADLVVSKRSGKVFAEVEKQLKARKKRFMHIGDSWIGDVQRPRQAGWDAYYFPISDREKRERQEALTAFIHNMDEKGIETRSWAKL